MALADITLADGQGSPVSHVFTFISQNGSKTIRSDLAASAETPLLLTIGHATRKVAGKTLGSHLTRIDKTVLDTDGITTYQANIRLMADVPVPIQSDALADDLAAFIRNWATAANVRAWLKGSVG